MGLKLFRLEVARGVLYFPMPALIAVLWLPNKSYTIPSRGAQFLKKDSPFMLSHVTAAKFLAGTNLPAGALWALIWFDRYSQRIPGVIESLLNFQVSMT